MGKTHNLTQDHIAQFEKAVRNNVRIFGLTDWLIDFDWIDDPDNHALAQVETNTGNRVALFQLNSHWNDQPTSRRIDRVAYHETLELLLSPICTIAKLDEGEVTPVGKICLLEAERHAIIRRLENLYMGEW